MRYSNKKRAKVRAPGPAGVGAVLKGSGGGGCSSSWEPFRARSGGGPESPAATRGVSVARSRSGPESPAATWEPPLSDLEVVGQELGAWEPFCPPPHKKRGPELLLYILLKFSTQHFVMFSFFHKYQALTYLCKLSKPIFWESIKKKYHKFVVCCISLKSAKDYFWLSYYVRYFAEACIFILFHIVLQ